MNNNNNNVRICEVSIYPNKKPTKGIFHRFIDLSTPKDGEFIRQTLCMVELIDGKLVQVTPKKIRFLDTETVFAYEWSTLSQMDMTETENIM